MTAEDFGKQAEKYFLAALVLLGVKVCNRTQVNNGKKPQYPLVIARATRHEDDTQGTDWWLFVQAAGSWYRLDPTVASNPKVLAKKRCKARETGAIVIRFNGRTLELASKGSHRDLKEIEKIMMEVVQELLEK